VYEYFEELDQMNWSARDSNVLNQYLRNTSIGTTVMIFPKQRKKPPNFALTKELNEITNKSTKFWLEVWQDWALTSEYDVDIEKYPILSC
jgi:hypothetical protein